MAEKRKRNDKVETIDLPDFDIEAFVTAIPLSLDMPGIFFVEARKRVRLASLNLEKLNLEVSKHQRRVKAARSGTSSGHPDDPWTDVIHGVASFETLFGKTVRDYAVADVLLVASAESYINVIAAHILPSSEAGIFDKLSPVGKWLFLPKIMDLKWRPTLENGSLQEFAKVVARRNRVVHPKLVVVTGTATTEDFLTQLRLDAKQASRGINSVKGLIQGISSSWRGSSGPNWLFDSMAKNHPPCFTLGGPEFAGRLGRPSRKSKGRL